MVSRCLAYAAVAACATLLASPVFAGPRAVLELFTSQGCSSCPAADRLLGKLTADPSLIAVSLSIDVWDYLGWRDTLADPRNTARWQAYSRSRGDGQRYTPQVVVNGAMHAIGSDMAAIDKAIAKTRQDAATMSAPVKVARAGDRLVVELPEGAPPAAALVSVWSLSKAIPVAITRGENKGRTVTYHNVVRRMIDLGPWTATSHRWSVPLRDLAGEEVDMAAVTVQTGTAQMPGLMLGAAMLDIR